LVANGQSGGEEDESHDMPPPRPVTEMCSGILEPGRLSRALSTNMCHAAGRPDTPPADRMYMTDVRQTDLRRHHRLMPPGRGHNKLHNKQNQNIIVVSKKGKKKGKGSRFI